MDTNLQAGLPTGDVETDPNALPESLAGWVTYDAAAGTYSLRLSRAVKHGDRELSSLEGRRPCARHLRALPVEKPTMGDWIEVFARSSGTPSAVIDQMDGADVLRVVALVGFFIGGGRATGPTS